MSAPRPDPNDACIHRALLPECAHLSPQDRLNAIAEILTRGVIRVLTRPSNKVDPCVQPERSALMVRHDRAFIGGPRES